MISRIWNSLRLYDPGASSLTLDSIFRTTNSSVGGFYPGIDTLLCSCLRQETDLVHFCVIMILSVLATLSHRMVRSPRRVFWFRFTLVSRIRTIKSVCFYWRPLTHLEVHASRRARPVDANIFWIPTTVLLRPIVRYSGKGSNRLGHQLFGNVACDVKGYKR